MAASRGSKRLRMPAASTTGAPQLRDIDSSDEPYVALAAQCTHTQTHVRTMKPSMHENYRMTCSEKQGTAAPRRRCRAEASPPCFWRCNGPHCSSWARSDVTDTRMDTRGHAYMHKALLQDRLPADHATHPCEPQWASMFARSADVSRDNSCKDARVSSISCAFSSKAWETLVRTSA